MTTSDRMSDPMERLRAEIGYRMWCLDQGYMSDKDREGCDNWLLLPDSELHGDRSEGKARDIGAGRLCH